MSNEMKKQVAATLAWLGGMILLLLWVNASIGEMTETPKPRSSAFSGRAMLLETPANPFPSEPWRTNGPDFIVWVNAKTGKAVKGSAGSWGVPDIEPLPIPFGECRVALNGTVDMAGWRCNCTAPGPAFCFREWTGPPPLIPARSGLKMNGYISVCKRGVMRHECWRWVPERRPI